MTLRDMKASRGFTLIELLVVIAIIGILMALLFPAVSGALDAAKKAQAKNDVTQIATAVVAFETEYGRLPSSQTGDVTSLQLSGDILNALMASNDMLNPRKIVFIETQNWKKGKGGIQNGTWKDPWGNDYLISMDTSYDNQVSGGMSNTVIRKKVAVWNNSQIGRNAAEKNRRSVSSWE